MTTSTTGPGRAGTNYKLREKLGQIAVYLMVAAVSPITVFPVYWMAVSTFQPNKYTMHFPPPLYPKEILLTQFVQLSGEHPVALWLRNSFLIALITMLLCTVLCVAGAYALSSLRWKGRSFFGLFLLITQMLPEILVLIPLYGASGFVGGFSIARNGRCVHGTRMNTGLGGGGDDGNRDRVVGRAPPPTFKALLFQAVTRTTCVLTNEKSPHKPSSASCMPISKSRRRRRSGNSKSRASVWRRFRKKRGGDDENSRRDG